MTSDMIIRTRSKILLMSLERLEADGRTSSPAIVRRACGEWVCDQAGEVKNQCALETATALCRWLLREDEG